MLFDRPEADDNAVLVHVQLDDSGRAAEHDETLTADHAATRLDDDALRAEALGEFAELARAAGARIVGTLEARRARPAPRYFLGQGKAEELKALIAERDAHLAIFDHDLSPAQERNLEQLLEARVLSRTGLILDIFAQRARTHEGKLQVELAQLDHMSARLVRGWSHLDREKGGIGLRGAGEKQLELDQRLIQGRISAIRKRLGAVRRTRAQSRRSRQRAELPLVALVGYTNTGKSTLFNALSDSGVLAADQLFATLDPTLRRVDVPGLGPVVLADTVGFVRRLPHKLVEAFKATLEEVVEADLLLHVLDASDPARNEKRAAVHEVLAEIDALDIPCIEVFNKIDACEDAVPSCSRTDTGTSVRISAAQRLGLELLTDALAESLGDAIHVAATLDAADGRTRARCYEQGWVEDEQTGEDGSVHLALHLPRAAAERLAVEGVSLTPAPATPLHASSRGQGSVATPGGAP